MTQRVGAHPTASQRSLGSRLQVEALGLGLLLLVSVAWGTGLTYLLVRAGLPSPVRLVLIDGVHAYVGLASLIFISGKILRVGFRTRVSGVPDLILWHRWISRSLLVLYGAVYLTGLMLLLPWMRLARDGLANAHLLASVWAAVPTTWHVWHYRHRAVPYLPGRQGVGSFTRRLGIGLIVVLIPVSGVLAVPRALSPYTRTGADGAWRSAALNGVFLDRLAASPSGDVLVAGGQGLYWSDDTGATWRSAPGLPRDDVVLGLAVSPRTPAVYAGTASGLYAAARPEGPYRRLPFPAHEVHGVAVDPSDVRVVWTSSRQGFWLSTDAGEHWRREVSGLRDPTTSWALAYFAHSFFGSDAFAVYRWAGTSWVPTSDQSRVTGLDQSADGSRLFASSMGDGIRVFDGLHWRRADQGLARHGNGASIHVNGVTEDRQGRFFAATMRDGVARMGNRADSWEPLGTGLPRGSVWRVVEIDSRLLAATDRGLYQYPLVQPKTAGMGWWSVVVGGALIAGILAVALAAWPKGDWALVPPGSG